MGRRARRAFAALQPSKIPHPPSTTRAEKGSSTASSSRSVRIEIGDAATSTVPGGDCGGFAQAHWLDEFHEADEAHPRLIVGAGRRSEIRARQLIIMDRDAVSEVEARRAVTEGWFFQRGENVGAALLSKHLLALNTRDGQVSCVDDVSGETLSEEGVRAARALEMFGFVKNGRLRVRHQRRVRPQRL